MNRKTRVRCGSGGIPGWAVDLILTGTCKNKWITFGWKTDYRLRHPAFPPYEFDADGLEFWKENKVWLLEKWRAENPGKRCWAEDNLQCLKKWSKKNENGIG